MGLTQAMENPMTHAESDPIVIACEPTAGGATMMGRAPIDLQATTRDIKNRCARSSGNLEQIAKTKELSSPIQEQS